MSGGGTPRQQMIGLMYLVLLAMLAMNASKDLLNAFVKLEHGIDKTVFSFNQANSGYYSVIDKAAASGEKSYKATAETANKLKEKAQSLIDHIALHKVALVSKGEIKSFADTANGMLAQYYDEHGIPLSKDDQDFGAQYFLVNEQGKNGKDLANEITVFKEEVVKILNNDGDESNDYLVGKYEKLFNTEDSPDEHNPEIKTSWASKMSEHLPLASVTANLSLWQSYIRNAEADVISSMASKLDGEGMTVDKATGMATFENGYVLKGDTVSGSVFIAAYNSKVNPTVYLGQPDTALFNKGGGQVKFAPGVAPKIPIIGANTTMAVKNGKGMFKVPADEVGAKTLQGVVEIKSAKGTFYYMYKSNYMVAEPTATIAATAMNVFYVGVDNPVSISAPGASLDDLEVRGAGVSFRAGKKPGEYIARASKPNGKGTMIDVVKKDGTKLGGMKFRLKRLPDPAASILNQKEGLVSKGKLKAATFIKAEMENFDFDVKVTVNQFKMTVSKGGDLKEFATKGNKLTGAMRSMLSAVSRGDRVYFEDIKVKLPDGTTRNVPSIILKVN